MKLQSLYFQVLACLFTLLAFHSRAFAPPADKPGWLWGDRAFAYAAYFCNRTNPEYGRCYDQWGYEADCANFTSQIANAGCSGMAETNRTNWAGWTAPDSTCWDYFDTEPDHNYAHGCHPDSISGGYYYTPTEARHRVIRRAKSQSYWLYCADSNFVNQKVCVRTPQEVPEWVGMGTFVFQKRWDESAQRCKYHAVFIDRHGIEVYYYAHTNDRCGAISGSLLSELFSVDEFDHMEFYRPRIFGPKGEEK